MKKIITLIFFAGLVSTSFAQTGHRKKIMQQTMRIVANLHGRERATLGMRKLPIAWQEIQKTNGTNEVKVMDMVTTVAGKVGIDTKAITMVITVITGIILTETATGEVYLFRSFYQDLD